MPADAIGNKKDICSELAVVYFIMKARWGIAVHVQLINFYKLVFFVHFLLFFQRQSCLWMICLRASSPKLMKLWMSSNLCPASSPPSPLQLSPPPLPLWRLRSNQSLCLHHGRHHSLPVPVPHSPGFPAVNPAASVARSLKRPPRPG